MIKPADIDPQLNFDLNFDEFVPGQSNLLARSAGLNVSENPGRAFNPMFIYGPSGVGKTHLANAIGIAAKANIYDKDFNFICDCNTVSSVGCGVVSR